MGGIATVLAAFLAILPATAYAIAFEVEEWSVTAGTPGGPQVSFFDDFEDGVFSDSFYDVPCGSVGPLDESDSPGALLLRNPSLGAPCSAFRLVEAVSALAGFSGDATASAEYRFQVPAISESYGIQIASDDGPDLVSIALAREVVEAFPGWFVDALVVTIFDETFTATNSIDDLLGYHVLSLDPPSYTATSIEFRIEIAEEAGGLEPTFSYSLNGGGFVEIPPSDGTLDPSGTYYGVLVATAPVPEPAVSMLVAFGLVFLAALRRCR